MGDGDPVHFLSFAFSSATRNGRFVSAQMVWHPVSNRSIPWTNYDYIISNASGAMPRGYAVFIPVSSTSFIVAQPPEQLT